MQFKHQILGDNARSVERVGNVRTHGSEPGPATSAWPTGPTAGGPSYGGNGSETHCQ